MYKLGFNQYVLHNMSCANIHSKSTCACMMWCGYTYVYKGAIIYVYISCLDHYICTSSFTSTCECPMCTELQKTYNVHTEYMRTYMYMCAYICESSCSSVPSRSLMCCEYTNIHTCVHVYVWRYVRWRVFTHTRSTYISCIHICLCTYMYYFQRQRA